MPDITFCRDSFMKRFIILSVGIATIVGVSIGAIYYFRSPTRETYGALKRGDIVQKVTIAATVVPNRRTVFVPPYNAYIKKIHVKLGSMVKMGDPVVALSQTLHGSEETHPLRAPFTGTVVQVLRSEGEFVEQGKDYSSIIRMDDLSKLFVYCDIPESSISKIRSGQQVLIKTNANPNKLYHGVIGSIFGSAKEKQAGGSWRRGEQVEFETRVEVKDPDENLRPGMSAIVDIITSKKEAIPILGNEFVEKTREGYYVTLATGDKHKIEVGIQDEDNMEVLSGLKESDKVRLVDFFKDEHKQK